MKRHEYRDINFWKKLDKKDFAIISSINNYAIGVLIDKMRGNRTLEQYAYECDVSTSTLYRAINDERKRPFHYDILLALYQKRDVNCGVGFEHLLAANGMMLLEDITKNQDKLLKKNGIKVDKTKKKVDKKQKEKAKLQYKACKELKKLIKEMKGNRNYEEFAFDCGLPKGTIVYIVNGLRKTSLTETQLKKMYDNRYPGSNVTLKQLKKANKIFPSQKRKTQDQEIEVALATIEPEDQKIQTEKPSKSISYDEFLQDLSFYLMRKPEHLIPGIRKESKIIYKNEGIRNLLHKFKTTSEYEWNLRVSEVRNYFEDKGFLSQTKRKEPEILEEKLDKLLIS